MATLVKPSWKDVAIERSVVITDAWEVFKIYAGRAAEWVLFGCMVLNIVEMLPGVTFWFWFANGIMATQVVTLDIAGFGLASMAEYARECGHEQAAKQASWTAKLLIGIMIVTLVSVTGAVLFPALRPFLIYAEDVLILVRVVMVVIYGHVIHRLRRITGVALPPAQSEEIARLQEALSDLQEQAQQSAQEWQAKMVMVEQKSGEEVTRLVSQVSSLTEQLASLQSSLTEQKSEQIATVEASESEHQSDDAGDGKSDASIIHLVNKKASVTLSRGEAVKRAQRIIKNTPTITPTELAKRAKISRSYASQLLKEA